MFAIVFLHRLSLKFKDLLIFTGQESVEHVLFFGETELIERNFLCGFDALTRQQVVLSIEAYFP